YLYRELDIDEAVSRTTYTVDGVDYKREAIASIPDRVIVVQLTASKTRSISFTAHYVTPQPGVDVRTDDSKRLTFSGRSIDHETVEGKVRYKGMVEFKNSGGTVSKTDTSVSIKNADAVTIFISIATNFNNYNDISGNAEERVSAYLKKAASKPYATILKGHIAAYQKLFRRVKFDLGTSAAIDLPTDERLKMFHKTVDPQFAVLYFQFGRYLLISSSQPGGQPANLQGIWNNKLYPPWDSKYTININAQMNYWPAEKTNLSELHEPFLQMVREMAVTGAKTAKDMYGARGWMAHHNTDIWRATGAVDGAFWGLWNQGGGWTSQHLWERYLYTGDKKFLL
ncbi:MAG: glycoside hydrolase family 95 protein, partial [Chitinophagaceae bacterium]